MHWSRAGRRVACARGHVVVLCATFCDDLDTSANSVPVALGSLKLELQPMIFAGTVVHPNLRRSVNGADHHIYAPVAIEVPDSRPSVPGRRERSQSNIA